jgi:hypothetical protein
MTLESADYSRDLINRAGNEETTKHPSRTLLALALSLALIVGCGEYDGGDLPEADPFSGSASPSGISETEQVAAFEATLWPLLTSRTCGDCHTTVNGRTPFLLADGNSTVAFRAIVDNGKVNFDNASASRLVARLASDQHHCWSDCSGDGLEMHMAIEAWVADIEARGGNSSGGEAVSSGTLVSSVVGADEGVEDEGGERYTSHMIGFWKFDEQTGDIARDSSGVSPAMDIRLGDDVSFMESYGLDFSQGTASSFNGPSRKLYDQIAHPDVGSGQFSVEMWIVPANTNQQSDLVRYSNEFRIRQRLYQYDTRTRSRAPAGGDDGISRLVTYDVDRDLQSGLQHAMLTYDRFNGMRIYVNGEFTDDIDEAGGALLWNWGQSSRLTLGQGGDNGWVGQLRMLAIYRQALSPARIMQNYLAGVGLRLTLNFDISQWAGPGSRIEMSMSQIDDQSYILCQPTLVTQNAGLRIRGMRVNINGQTPAGGQGFSKLNTVSQSGRQQLSNLCSIVENPPGPDSFQLTFEGLGQWIDPVDEPSWPPITYDYANVEQLPTHGVRDFAKINETMAALTGVSAGNPAVTDTYLEIQQQLPGSYDVRSFVSSNQVGIAKLAVKYCSELVDSAGLRAAFFDSNPGFEFNLTPDVAFQNDVVEDKRRRITEPLVRKMIGEGLDTVQPDLVAAEGTVLALVDTLVADCGACDAAATQDIVAGACIAVLASGATAMH